MIESSAREEKLKELEDRSLPILTQLRGVTIAFLVALCFMLELQAVQGYTGEVMRDFIVPLTNGSRCRFVELEVMRKSGVVGSGRGDDVYQLL